MAFVCPFCKSAVTQALVDNLQCLACGRLFKFDGSAVTPDPVFEAPDSENPDRRIRPGDVIPGVVVTPPTAPLEVPATPPVVAPVVTPDPIDLSSLNPEQVAAIEAIAHFEEG